MHEGILLSFVKSVDQTKVNFLNLFYLFTLSVTPIIICFLIELSLLQFITHLVFHLPLNLRNLSYQLIVRCLSSRNTRQYFVMQFFS